MSRQPTLLHRHVARLFVFVDCMLRPGNNVLLEPVHVGRHSPLYDDIKPIENGPDTLNIGRCPKRVWSYHNL